MPGAVRKILSVALRLDVVARGLVHFPSADLALRGEGIRHHLDAGIASAANDVEDLTVLVAGLADDARPSDVVKDGVRLVLLRPHLDQDEVPFADRLRAF